MQHGPLPGGSADIHFKVPAEIAIQANGLQIVVENCEQARFPQLQFELLAQLSAQRRNVILACIDAAAEQTPMAGVPDVRNVIP